MNSWVPQTEEAEVVELEGDMGFGHIFGTFKWGPLIYLAMENMYRVTRDSYIMLQSNWGVPPAHSALIQHMILK